MSTVTVWHPGVVLSPIDLTPPIIDAIKTTLEPEQVLALTAWRESEARLEPGHGWVRNPPAAHLDIMNVVANRAKDRRWRTLGHKGVCLQHRQFSCWDTLGGPENFHRLITAAQHLLAGELPAQPLLDCLAMAHATVSGGTHDELRAATHYYSTTMLVPPEWAAAPAVMTAERWGHRFFANVR